MRKRATRILAVILSLVLLAGSLSACGGNSEVKDLIKRFETACQTLDAEGILDCCNPRLANSIKSVVKLLVGSEGLNDIVSGLADIWGVIDFKSSTPKDILKSLEIKMDKFNTNEAGDRCEVDAVFHYADGSKKVESSVRINCVKGDSGWYISSIKGR